MIVADFNGPVEAFPTITSMLKDQGWTDIGMSEEKCGPATGAPTCHTNEGARETRIDYIFTNEAMTPVVLHCEVDNTSGFPTHRPLAIEVNIKKLKHRIKTLHKTTDFAELFENKLRE